MPLAATWIFLEIIIPSEGSQTEKDKYHMMSHVQNLKQDTNALIYETETDLQTQKASLGLPKGKEAEVGINQEFGISRYKVLYIKYINNKVLQYSTGNYIQHSVINHNRKEYEKEYVYTCTTESLCCTPETNTL